MSLRRPGANRQPTVPFRMLAVILYSSSSWITRYSENGALYVEFGVAPMSRQVRQQRDRLRRSLDFLLDIGAILAFSKPKPGTWRVHLRPIMPTKAPNQAAAASSAPTTGNAHVP